jgi:hypothetical protein
MILALNDLHRTAFYAVRTGVARLAAIDPGV